MEIEMRLLKTIWKKVTNIFTNNEIGQELASVGWVERSETHHNHAI
jgi:hypothetical protein